MSLGENFLLSLLTWKKVQFMFFYMICYWNLLEGLWLVLPKQTTIEETNDAMILKDILQIHHNSSKLMTTDVFKNHSMLAIVQSLLSSSKSSARIDVMNFN